ncbi:cytosine permease [Streptomyces sp. NPDC014724]|uniref:cytosine permease n=1 Tax=unclassified Streptomyces TaxID=2593676 RepID=UPI0037020A61
MTALHSAQGPQLGVPQMIQSRGQFGYVGALAVVLVVIVMYQGLAAMRLAAGDAAAVFGVVLTVAVTTLLLSYLAIIPALVALRVRHGEVARPYRVPFGTAGFMCCAGLVYVWILVGSWSALFPGTLESVLGIGYDFHDIWGVSRLTFEGFTLGTVTALLLIGTAGHAVARRRRAPEPLTV